MASKKENQVPAVEEKALERIKYKKSNRLINARGKASAMVQKIFTIAITEAKPDKDGNFAAVISGTMLRKIFGNYSGSFYESVRVACDSGELRRPDLLSWRIRIENREKMSFDTINVVTRATFVNGILRIKFNSDIKDDIYNLTSQYTELYQYVVIRMQSPYSIQLYERFQSEMDYQRARYHDNEGPYTIVYSLEDMRDIFSLDFETVENGKREQRHLHSEFPDFRKHVLDVAKKEINSIAPIHMEYETIRAGRGGRVQSIRFILTRKQTEDKEDAKPLSKEELLNRKLVFADAASLLSELDVKAVQSICKAADYNFDKIEKAYNIAQKTKGIKNLAGWMIQAIRDGYETNDVPVQKKEPKKRTRKTAVKKNSYQDFEQTDYDFDEIERNFINN